MRLRRATFGVRSTSRDVLGWLVDALEGTVDVQLDADPDDEYLFSLAVDPRPARAGRRIHTLYRGSWAAIASTDPVAVGRAFIAELDAISLSERTDHPYLDAALARVGGAHVLLPAVLAAAVSPSVRRARRRGVDVALPVTSSVAVLADGSVRAPSSVCDVRDESWGSFPGAATAIAEGDRYVLDGGVRVDAAVRPLFLGSGWRDATPGEVLLWYASGVRNLRSAAGGGLAALGALFANARCASFGWGPPSDLLSGLPELTSRAASSSA